MGDRRTLFTEIPLERAQLFGQLLTAARAWRDTLIPNTSTGIQGPTADLIAAVEALDNAVYEPDEETDDDR